MRQVLEELQRIKETVTPLQKMAEDVATMKEIVVAWNSVKLFGRFMKWLAGVVAGVMFLVALWSNRGHS